MISATAIAASFERNVSIVKMQTDSMTQTDSLVQLPFRANCMNWVIGHLVTNRLNVIKLLEGLPTFDPAPLARYKRESEPVTGEAEGVLRLDELIHYLEQAQAQIANLLASADPESFMRQVAFFGNLSMTIGEWLLFFYFHDSYHTGQTEIYRQAAGKNDKII
jgi:hypothetical protein